MQSGKSSLFKFIQYRIRNLVVDDIIAVITGGSCKKTIPQKVRDVIEGLSSFSVFRKADVWERKNSVAYDILEEECRNARPLIRQRVEQIVNEYKFPLFERAEIMYTIADVLTDRLLPEKEEK